MLTVTVEEGQKTGDQSKSPPPAPVVPNSVPRKVSPTPIVKSSTTTLPKSSSASSITALLGTRPRRATGRTLGSRNPDFQVSLIISKMCSLCYQPPLLVQSLFLTSRLRITQINIKQFKQLCGSYPHLYMCLILHKLTFCVSQGGCCNTSSNNWRCESGTQECISIFYHYKWNSIFKVFFVSKSF